MAKFVVYEVWTRARIVEAVNHRDAYKVGEPQPVQGGFNLCNWHVVAVDGTKEKEDK
jgi:hypothetical protein